MPLSVDRTLPPTHCLANAREKTKPVQDTALPARLQRAGNRPALPATPQSRSCFYTQAPGSLQTQMHEEMQAIFTQNAVLLYMENNYRLASLFNALAHGGLLPLTGALLQQHLPILLTEKKHKSGSATETWAGMLRRIPTLLQGLSQGCTTPAPRYAERIKQQMEQHNACFLQIDLNETTRLIEDSDAYANQVADGLNRLYLAIRDTLPVMLIVDGEVENREAIWSALLASEKDAPPRPGENREEQEADGQNAVRLRPHPVAPAGEKRRAWRESDQQTPQPSAPEPLPRWNTH
jgi:hypothetical protein